VRFGGGAFFFKLGVGRVTFGVPFFAFGWQVVLVEQGPEQKREGFGLQTVAWSRREGRSWVREGMEGWGPFGVFSFLSGFREVRGVFGEDVLGQVAGRVSFSTKGEAGFFSFEEKKGVRNVGSLVRWWVSLSGRGLRGLRFFFLCWGFQRVVPGVGGGGRIGFGYLSAWLVPFLDSVYFLGP